MRKSKKTIAILAIIAMVLMMLPVQAFADNAAASTSRLAGADRIGTALAIANQGWANGASSVIVVPADDANLVDALAVAPLAGQLKAPILMTYKASLDSSVASEITTLKATNVYAVGALSSAVVDQLKAISGVTVTQIQGADRFATAAQVAAMLTNPAGTFVVGYNGLADAMSAASFAAANGYAIAIANTDGTLPSSEKLVGSKDYILGGPTLVADSAAPGATRIYGSDRYATNDQVLTSLSYKYDTVYVANGETLVDALAGSALAALTGSPIVLGNTTGAAAAADVNKSMTSSSKVIAFGGAAVVPDSVVSSVAGTGTVTPPANNGTVTVTGTPAAATSVGATQQLVKVMTLNVSASANSQLTGMKIARSGLSSDSDIASVVVYDGNARLNVPAIVGNGIADFDFTNPLQLTAGQSKSLDVYMNMDAVDSSNKQESGKQIVLTVQEVRGSGTVQFAPVTSNLFTTAAVDLGTMAIQDGSGTTTAQINADGQPVEIWKYKFSATNEDVKMNRVVFTQDGSAGAGDVKDFTLWNGATQVAGPVQMASDRTVTFAFPDGLLVQNGGSVTLSLQATVVGGSGRTLLLGIDNNVDALGIGQTYGTNVVADNEWTLPAGDAREIKPGSLIISNDPTSPAAGTIGSDTKAVTFGAIKAQAVGEPIQIQKVRLQADVTGVASVSDLKNVKLVSGGVTLGTVSDGFVDAAHLTATLDVPLSRPLTVNPGTPATIDLVSDVGPTYGAGDTIRVTFVKVVQMAQMTTGKTLNDADIDPNNIPFSTMTVGAMGLTPSEVAGLDTTVYPGQSNVTLDEFNLSHNLSENVLLGGLQVDVTTATNVSNLKLEDTTGNVISNIIATPGATNQFNLTTPITVTPGQTILVKVVGDINSSATSNSTFKLDNNNVVASGVTSGNDVGFKTAAAVGGHNPITCASSWNRAATTVTYSTFFDISGGNNALYNASDVNVGGWTLENPSNEKVSITAIHVVNDTTTSTIANNKFGNIRIVDANGNVLGSATGFGTNESDVKVNLTQPYVLGTGTSNQIDIAVKVDFLGSNSGAFDKTLKLGLGTIEATATFTGETADFNTAGTMYSDDSGALKNDAAVYTTTPATVNVAAVAVTNPITTSAAVTTGSAIGQFNITNNGNTVISPTQLKFTDTLGSSSSQLDGVDVAIYKASDGTLLSTTNNLLTGGSVTIDLSKALRVDPGATQGVIVRVTNTNSIAVTGASVSLRMASGSNFYDLLSNFAGGLQTYSFDSSATSAVVTYIKQ